MSPLQFHVGSQHAAQTVAAVLRVHISGLSWSESRRRIHTRCVKVNGVICVDDARRLKAGDQVELLNQSPPPLPGKGDVSIVHEDREIVVIEKPAGMECERRFEQRTWTQDKRLRQPTVVEALEMRGYHVHPVHRLDRDTSGLMVYARTADAQQRLISAFARHDIERRYLAVAIGRVESGTAHTWIVRDRGDGLRGSAATKQDDAEEAITHFRAVEPLAQGKYTLLECQLETGKTHQIRIHLAEMGHPLCGEKLYLKPRPGVDAVVDDSAAPRQALHCRTLGFAHPTAGTPLRFESSWPADLKRWLSRIRVAAE